MILKMIFSGFGGQGILTLGKLVAQMAMNQGKYVTWIPSYGMEMRGGTTNCSVIISEDVIGCPIIGGDADVLCAMNNPSAVKFVPSVKKGGCVILNSSIVKEEPRRKDIRLIKIDATNIAASLKNIKTQNMAMLAGILKFTDRFSLGDIKAALEHVYAGKNGGVVASNMKVIEYALSR